MGFLTKTREATGADKPVFGGGNFVDTDAMVAREVVFGISKVEWDGDNMYEGNPRPRWLLDIFPWYEGEMLPGKADSRGRPSPLEAGRLSLAAHRNRDDMMETLGEHLEKKQERDADFVEGPGVLVKIRVPGGKGGRYIDLCEWDEEAEAPVGMQGEVVEEEEAPRRPSSRQAPARRGGTGRTTRASASAAEENGRSRRRTAQTAEDADDSDDEGEGEPEGDDEVNEPEEEPRQARSSRSTKSARGAGTASNAATGFGDAGGAESGDGEAPAEATAPAPASDDIMVAVDLDFVSDVLGLRQERYRSAYELAEEYPFEPDAFPGIKQWLSDHGINDFPKGRGRIREDYRGAHSIALRCWSEVRERRPNDNPSRTSPNPAVQSGRVRPTGSRRTAPAAADGDGEGSGPASPPRSQIPPRGRSRTIQPAEVPANALAGREQRRPPGADDVDPTTGRDRAAGKAAWMPPDEQARRAAGGPVAATEYQYEVSDIGDSIEPCPGCHTVVTGRALPAGGGQFRVMHKCDGDGVTRPLQVTNLRKG